MDSALGTMKALSRTAGKRIRCFGVHAPREVAGRRTQVARHGTSALVLLGMQPITTGGADWAVLQSIAFLVIVTALLVGCAVLLRARNRDREVAARQGLRHAREVDDLVHQQELRIMEALKRGEERERSRGENDLKERLNTLFTTLREGFGHLEERLDTMEQHQEEHYEQVLFRLDETMTDLRRAGKASVRLMLERFGLASVLEDMRWALEAPGSLRVALSVQGLAPRLDRTVQVGLYHLVNDAVDAALGHEGVDRLAIRIERLGDRYALSVEDNGGADREEQRYTDSRRRLQGRIAGLGGSFNTDRLPLGGHALRVEIPLQP